MKIDINITKAEIKKLVLEKYNLPDCNITIIYGSELTTKIMNGLSDLPNIPDNRIKRIIRLREMFPSNEAGPYKSSMISLSSAKQYIESFDRFIAYVDEHNSLPPNHEIF